MVDPWIAAVLIAAFCIYGYLSNLSAVRIRAATENAMESGTTAWIYGLDAIVNVDHVQQANLRAGIIEQLNKKLKINDKHWKVTFSQRVYYGVLQTFVFGGVVIWVLWRSALDVSTGVITVGELVLINTYIVRLLQPVEALARVYREMHASAGEAVLLMRLLAENPVRGSQNSELPVANKPWALQLANVDVMIGATPVIIARLNCLGCCSQPPVYHRRFRHGQKQSSESFGCLVPGVEWMSQDREHICYRYQL